MKYGNYLIVTLPDFRRHFDFRQFYKNRHRFVYDMHPSRIYYWNEDLKQAYYKICEWIGNFGSPMDIPREVVESLTLLTGRDIEDEMSHFFDISDFHAPVINISKDSDIVLPVFEESDNEIGAHLVLHKIKADNMSTRNSSVILGTSECTELEAGGIIYVTEKGGKFIDILSSSQENEFLTAHLIDNPGSFGSILVVTDKSSGVRHDVAGVVSFQLVGKGYIYINEAGRLVSIDNDTPMLFLRDRNRKAIHVKSFGDNIRVLFEDCTCKTTSSVEIMTNVYKLGDCLK